MYVIFSVNEQKAKMMGFLQDEHDNPAEFETLEDAQEWCRDDPFAPAKSHYIFDMDTREIAYAG